VNAFLRILIVWISLLALPLQGYASATMSLCAPATPAAQHEHESMDDHAAPVFHEHEVVVAADTDAGHYPAHHPSGKCATCATCCSCLPLALSFGAALPVFSSSSVPIPFDQGALPSVDLALPERPPRG
jgi:hypothetical protein